MIPSVPQTPRTSWRVPAQRGVLSWLGAERGIFSIVTNTSCHFFPLPTVSALPKRAIQSTLYTSQAVLACDPIVQSLLMRDRPVTSFPVGAHIERTETSRRR